MARPNTEMPVRLTEISESLDSMADTQTVATASSEVFVPHLGWLAHAPDEEVARSLNEGWFEYREQAFFWLYLHEAGTVVDCGAHIGLFSVLAGRLMGAEGRVIAVEPHPETSAILEQNLRSHRVASARVVRAAVRDRPGVALLTLGTTGRAAYSSLLSIEGKEETVEVPTLALDELATAHHIGKIDLLKLDVEGLEIEALAGARQLLADRQVQALLLEFTEENLNRGARSSVDLQDAITRAGYALYRFDDDDLSLKPATVTAPIAYENLFAIDGPPDSVNARLTRAPADRRRVAQQIIRRGRACTKLHDAAANLAPLRRQLDGAAARIQEQAARIQNQAARIQEQEHVLESLRAQLKHSEQAAVKLRKDYQRVKNSWSWRCTRPLRGVADFLGSVGGHGHERQS